MANNATRPAPENRPNDDYSTVWCAEQFPGLATLIGLAIHFRFEDGRAYAVKGDLGKIRNAIANSKEVIQDGIAAMAEFQAIALSAMKDDDAPGREVLSDISSLTAALARTLSILDEADYIVSRAKPKNGGGPE